MCHWCRFRASRKEREKQLEQALEGVGGKGGDVEVSALGLSFLLISSHPC